VRVAREISCVSVHNRFKTILQRIEKIYSPEQFPVTADTPWADLVNLLALRPKARPFSLCLSPATSTPTSHSLDWSVTPSDRLRACTPTDTRLLT
jgi:hypothetical protein